MTRPTQHDTQWHEVLKALREAAGLSQQVWAVQLGVSRATIQRWERGETPPSDEAERSIIEWACERRMFREFRGGLLQGITINETFLHDMLLEARGTIHTKVEEEPDSEGKLLDSASDCRCRSNAARRQGSSRDTNTGACSTSTADPNAYSSINTCFRSFTSNKSSIV
jgi:transcriptional regulator with XRE-family HTH domain